MYGIEISLSLRIFTHRTCNIAISGSTIAPDREECNDFEPQHRGTSPNHPPFPAKIPANCLVIFSPTSHFLTWLGHAWGETDITASLRKNFLPQWSWRSGRVLGHLGFIVSFLFESGDWNFEVFWKLIQKKLPFHILKNGWRLSL